MTKTKVIEQIQAYLVEELQGLLQAAQSAHAAATGEESRPENGYDTRALEASYLAGAQAERAGELKRLLTMYKFLPIREYGPTDVICPATLVELEINQTRAFYFIAPQGGGLVTRVDGKPVQVITPQSPIGEALLGRKVGDVIEIEVRDQIRRYKVIGIV